MSKSAFNLLGKSGNVLADDPSAAQIETFENRFQQRDYIIQFHCVDFTSLCPVTGQPDFAEIEIQYTPDQQCIETKSLKYYLHSYRNTKSFNEAIVNRIFEDLSGICTPRWMKVTGKFAARGGITLTAVVEHPKGK